MAVHHRRLSRFRLLLATVAILPATDDAQEVNHFLLRRILLQQQPPLCLIRCGQLQVEKIPINCLPPERAHTISMVTESQTHTLTTTNTGYRCYVTASDRGND
uniref:Putative secreted peptide n=1 Tax=Anopheles braziliensis TaxID=58242 RepID=A0A2M3ZP49_9DIPT